MEGQIKWMGKHGLSREEAIKTIELVECPCESDRMNSWEIKSVQDAQEWAKQCSNKEIWKSTREKEFFDRHDNDDEKWRGDVSMKEFKEILLEERQKRGFTWWWSK